MFKFSKRELGDLTIAFVALTICFEIAIAGMNVNGIISSLPIVIVGVVIGSISHELGHKFTAIKYGCDAEFKLWPLGLLLGLVTSFFGFVFASPGSIHIHPEYVSDEVSGRIFIAGPMVNMVLAIILIAIAALIYPLNGHSSFFHLIYLICTIGFSVNSYLATFNLFPIYSLDGTKVLKWNAKIWIVAIVISGIMMLMSITIGAENMVKLFLVL